MKLLYYIDSRYSQLFGVKNAG